MSAEFGGPAGTADAASGAPLVIVGAGECGARAAFALRDLGHQGRIVLVGDEEHHPYERPPLSKGLAGPGGPSIVFTPEQMDEAGVEYLVGRTASALDVAQRTVTLDDGSQLEYARLLLATGAQARRLSCPGHAHARTFRTAHDAVELHNRLVPGTHLCVVGGGFIGLELAAMARQAGCQVTVLEAGPRMLARAVPVGAADALVARHRAAGVKTVTGVTVTSIESVEAGRFAVVTSDHGTVTCDLVLAGVGASPNVALAQDAGLAVDDGILVDDHLATSDRDVYAAGDCTRFPHPDRSGRTVRLEAWRNAIDQAEVAARNLLGHAEEYVPVPWFWSDQYDLGLQITGLPGGGRTEVARHYDDDRTIWFELDPGRAVLRASGIGPGTSVAKDIRVAQMMIAAGHPVDAADLADPRVPLKKILQRA